jgi:hypothetical protein
MVETSKKQIRFTIVILLRKWALLQLLAYLLFGGDASSNGYYFYEFSAHESTTIYSNGKVHTQRKSSV